MEERVNTGAAAMAALDAKMHKKGADALARAWGYLLQEEIEREREACARICDSEILGHAGAAASLIRARSASPAPPAPPELDSSLSPRKAAEGVSPEWLWSETKRIGLNVAAWNSYEEHVERAGSFALKYAELASAINVKVGSGSTEWRPVTGEDLRMACLGDLDGPAGGQRDSWVRVWNDAAARLNAAREHDESKAGSGIAEGREARPAVEAPSPGVEGVTGRQALTGAERSALTAGRRVDEAAGVESRPEPAASRHWTERDTQRLAESAVTPDPSERICVGCGRPIEDYEPYMSRLHGKVHWRCKMHQTVYGVAAKNESAASRWTEEQRKAADDIQASFYRRTVDVDAIGNACAVIEAYAPLFVQPQPAVTEATVRVLIADRDSARAEVERVKVALEAAWQENASLRVAQPHSLDVEAAAREIRDLVLPVAVSDERGWLVETKGRGGRPAWLASKAQCGRWTADSNSAIRFRSREDAQSVIALCGLGAEAAATEHVWIGRAANFAAADAPSRPAAPPAAPPAAQVSDEELAREMEETWRSTPGSHRECFAAAARRAREMLLGAQVKP